MVFSKQGHINHSIYHIMIKSLSFAIVPDHKQALQYNVYILDVLPSVISQYRNRILQVNDNNLQERNGLYIYIGFVCVRACGWCVCVFVRACDVQKQKKMQPIVSATSSLFSIYIICLFRVVSRRQRVCKDELIHTLRGYNSHPTQLLLKRTRIL